MRFESTPWTSVATVVTGWPLLTKYSRSGFITYKGIAPALDHQEEIVEDLHKLKRLRKLAQYRGKNVIILYFTKMVQRRAMQSRMDACFCNAFMKYMDIWLLFKPEASTTRTLTLPGNRFRSMFPFQQVFSSLKKSLNSFGRTWSFKISFVRRNSSYIALMIVR